MRPDYRPLPAGELSKSVARHSDSIKYQGFCNLSRQFNKKVYISSSSQSFYTVLKSIQTYTVFIKSLSRT